MSMQMFNLPLFLPAFGLVLLRLGGMMLTAPVLSGTGIPVKIKVFLVAAMALAVFPLVSPTLPAELNMVQLAVGAAGELLIGMTIGFCLALTLLAMQIGGLLVGQQSGFSMARVFNPDFGQQLPVLSHFYSLLTLVVFFAIGGHRALISAVLDTFYRVPPFSVTMTDRVMTTVIAVLTASFVVALKVAAPGLVALFVTTLAMGFVARTVPQLNILSIGFVIKIVTGLFVVAVSLAAVTKVYQGFFDVAVDHVDALWR